jgi:hypothetical protein
VSSAPSAPSAIPPLTTASRRASAARFDAQLTLDGKAFRPDGKSAATLNPAAFGLAGMNQHTWTRSWGSVTYWNAFVANLEMHGKGNFFDPRLSNKEQYLVAAQANLGNVRASEDRITPKLVALHFYQLAISVPKPPEGSFDRASADRERVVFNGKSKCAVCHVPPIFTEPGWNLHKPEEIGIDAFQADRAPDRAYRTTPLRALVVDKSVWLEEYAREQITLEEQHIAEVDQMMRKPGELHPTG